MAEELSGVVRSMPLKEHLEEFWMDVVKLVDFTSMQSCDASSVNQRFLLVPNQGYSKMIESVGIIGSDDGW